MSVTAEKPASGEMDRPLRQSNLFNRVVRSIRGLGRTATFFLKVFPMLPSRPVDWVTRTPVIEKVQYPTCTGVAEGEIYRPPGGGRHPGIVVCLGVVPFGVDHPQVPVLGRALARAGYAALLYWSPAMRDFRLDPVDIENIALAYDWFIGQPAVDPARSGLLGTCVGGSFALMAASSPRISDRVAFVSAYAPFSSMRAFAKDIASGSCSDGSSRVPWRVDQLTRRVFVHSLTASLDPGEAERLRDAFAQEGRVFDGGPLSKAGQQMAALLTAHCEADAEEAIRNLPADLQEQFEMLSPLNHVNNLRAPLFIHLHDRGDQVIPVGESRRLQAALNGRTGVHYTEMQFSHLDPVKGKLPLFRLIHELGKFFFAVYPIFRQAVP